MTTIVNALTTCIVKMFTFKGRASRTEFWTFYIFSLFVGIAIVPLEQMMGGHTLSTVVGLFFVLPTASAAARRLHDCDRSAMWLLLLALPAPLYWISPNIAGLALLMALLFLVLLLLLPGQFGPNRNGPDPRYRTDIATFE